MSGSKMLFYLGISLVIIGVFLAIFSKLYKRERITPIELPGLGVPAGGRLCRTLGPHERPAKLYVEFNVAGDRSVIPFVVPITLPLSDTSPTPWYSGFHEGSKSSGSFSVDVPSHTQYMICFIYPATEEEIREKDKMAFVAVKPRLIEVYRPYEWLWDVGLALIIIGSTFLSSILPMIAR